MPAASYTKGLTWLGHASFRLARGGVTIYFDPWQIPTAPHDADLILITHPHFDHLSPADVLKVAKPDTAIVTVEGCRAKLKMAGVPGTIQVVKPGDKLTVKGVPIEAVPAYNRTKTFHLKENRWVGFVVEVDQTRIYHAGDTDLIPEMKGIQADVALLPVSGTYVMTAEEAAQAAKLISAKVVVPMHYGSIVGTAADAQRFQKLCEGLIVEVLKRGEER
ncbi:MAG: MBL fold metallo-hydrolase [Candidatus Omnitrophica bacterium]|nr:MBL fold metallo-hydrolase [Candidatus Omnitrophota bacterium]